MSDTLQLSTEETIELIAFSVNNINQQFEFWLTITFAVIVASYIAGHKLSNELRYWFIALYALVSVLLLLMLNSSGAVLFTLAANSQISTALESVNYFAKPIMFLRLFIWVIGTGITIRFILKGFGAQQNSDETTNAAR